MKSKESKSTFYKIRYDENKATEQRETVLAGVDSRLSDSRRRRARVRPGILRQRGLNQAWLFLSEAAPNNSLQATCYRCDF
jgi:hypothetical protein